MKHSFLFATVVAGLLGTASAHATDVDSPKQIVVHYGDIDATKNAGAQILLSRIEVASQQVCDMSVFISDLSARQLVLNCASAAKARALASLPPEVAMKIENRNDSKLVASR